MTLSNLVAIMAVEVVRAAKNTVQKFNPYHDELGRFAEADGGGGLGETAQDRIGTGKSGFLGKSGFNAVPVGSGKFEASHATLGKLKFDSLGNWEHFNTNGKPMGSGTDLESLKAYAKQGWSSKGGVTPKAPVSEPKSVPKEPKSVAAPKEKPAKASAPPALGSKEWTRIEVARLTASYGSQGDSIIAPVSSAVKQLSNEFKAAAPKLFSAIEKSPVTELLEIVKGGSSHKGLAPKSNGCAFRHLPLALIRVPRRPGTWGQPFAPGKMWSMSFGQASHSEAVTATVVHEYSHRVCYQQDHRNNPEFLAAFKEAKSQGKTISQYARTNKDEYFAETSTAYHLNPDVLRGHDPGGYNYMKKVFG